jgi:hypothetical protein
MAEEIPMSDTLAAPFKRVLSINEFCRAYAIGRTKAYEEIGEGRLASFRLGCRRLILVEDAEAWLLALRTPAPPADSAIRAGKRQEAAYA